MKPYWSNDAGELYQGDVLNVLAGLPAGCAHMCVTTLDKAVGLWYILYGRRICHAKQKVASR